MSFDYENLKVKIRQVYGTQENFAKELGIGRVSLSLRLNNKAEFSQEEMHKSCDLLGLKRKEIAKYFFCEEGSETRTRIMERRVRNKCKSEKK